MMPLPRTLCFALTAGLAACAPLEGPPEDASPDAPVVDQVQPIHAEPTFDGCTRAQQIALRDALDFARERVQTADYRACLADAYGVEDEGRMVEELVADTNTGLSVEFRCKPGDTWAQAFEIGPGESEWMNIFGAFTTAYTRAQAGSTMVHEISHNHGWDHYHFYGPTWPDQVGNCVFRGHPLGARRSQVAGYRYLAHAGGAGGVERERRCNSDEALVGVVGALTADDRLVDLQPICQDIEGDARVGGAYTWVVDVPEGGARFVDQCPAGYGMSGLEGSADDRVERLRVVCAELADLRAMDGGVSTSTRPYRGRLQGRAYSRRCPRRTVATGLHWATGDGVHRFALECDDFPLDNRDGGTLRGFHGGGGGQPATRRCPGSMALTGVWGQWAPNGGSLATMGGLCRPMTDDGVALGISYGRNVAYTDFAGQVQQTEDEALRRMSRCPDGQVLVGLEVSAHHFVGDMAAICADAEDWLAGGDTTQREGALRTRAGETQQRIMCHSGEVGVALSLRVGDRVDQAGLRCRRPDAVGTLRHLPAVGDTASFDGTEGFEEVCSEGRAMVGLHTEVSGTLLRTLGGRCGRTTDAGTSVVASTLMAPVRGTDVADHDDDCGPGEVMIGLGVGYSDASVEWISGLCAAEDSLRDGGAPAGLRYTTWRGWTRDLHTVEDLRCPDGEVVRGLHGVRWRTNDAAYDQLRAVGPICGKPTLLPGDTARASISRLQPAVYPLTVPADFDGRLSLRLTGPVYMDPIIRVRRGAAPDADRFDAEVIGEDGFAQLIVDDLAPGRWFVEVGTRAIGGTATLRLDGI